MVPPMSPKNLPLSPQERGFVLELKDALAVPHRGPLAMPRKTVWMSLGRSESWYSLILDPDTLDLPNLTDLRRICAITRSREPLRIFERWLDAEREEGALPAPRRLLSEVLEADGLYQAKLARLLEDGDLSREDARKLIPLVAGRIRQNQEHYDLLKMVARGRR